MAKFKPVRREGPSLLCRVFGTVRLGGHDIDEIATGGLDAWVAETSKDAFDLRKVD